MLKRAIRSPGYAALVLLGPALLLVALMRLYPIYQAAQLAFTKWDGVGNPEWVGLANFRYFIHDATLHAAIVNSFFVLLSLPLWVLAPLFVAATLHSNVRAPRFFKAAIFLPSVLSPVVIGAYVNIILRYHGPLNQALNTLGLHFLTREWLYSERTALPIVIGVLLWATLGVGTLIFLSALAAVDLNLYEAARLDGASWLRVWWHITLPQVRPTIEYWSIIVLTSMFTALFPFIYMLTRGGPGTSTYVLEYYIYDRAFFSQAFGYASAIGLALLVVVSFVATAQIILFKRGEK